MYQTGKKKNKEQKEKEEIRKSNFNLNGYDPTIYKRKKHDVRKRFNDE